MARNKERGPVLLPNDEWIGGTFSLPGYVTDRAEPYRPYVAVWVDAGSRYIIAFEALPVGSPGSALAGVLEKALKDPANPASESRPLRVRISDPAALDAVRALLGPGIPVSVGPVPELEEIRHGFQDYSIKEARGCKDTGAGYLNMGRISAPVVAQFFEAAGELWRVAPWRFAADDQVLKLSVPSLGFPAACVSILGNAGLSFGLLVTASLADFKAHQGIAESLPERERREFPRDLGADLLAINFDKRAEMEESALREIQEYGWKVPAPDAYPVILRADRDAVPRPTTTEDYRVSTAACIGTARFVEEHYRLFSSRSPNPRTRSVSTEVLLDGDPSPTAVTVSAPFG